MQSNTDNNNDFFKYTDEEKSAIEEMMLNHSIVEIIKELMEKEGLRKADLAKKIGVTSAYITKVFTSDKYVNIPFLNKIQNAFQTTFIFNAKSLQLGFMNSLMKSFQEIEEANKEAKIISLENYTINSEKGSDVSNPYTEAIWSN